MRDTTRRYYCRSSGSAGYGLLLVLLLLVSVVALPRGQAQDTPTEPPPPASVVPTLKQVEKVLEDGTVGDAIDLLEDKLKALGDKATPEERRALLVKLADLYFYLGKYWGKHNEPDRAIAWYQKAYEIDKNYRTKDAAFDLYGIATVYENQGEKAKALSFYEQALPLWRKLEDIASEATTFTNIGSVYDSLGQYDRAIAYFKQALPLWKKAGHIVGEATTLNNIGAAYTNLGEKAQALASYEQALPLRRKAGDTNGEATTLNNIGMIYDDLGEKARALTFYGQALPLRQKAGDIKGEATTLNNIGSVYDSLGQKDKALDFYNQALPLLKKAGDSVGEASTLNNIGAVYDSSGQKDKALSYYEQALPLLRKAGHIAGEAAALNNIGNLHDSLGQKDSALLFYEQSLPLWRKIGHITGEAITLSNIGKVYDSRGQKDKAVSFYEQSLPLRRKAGDIAGEAITLNNLMFLWHDRTDGKQNPALAIYFGKQAVNNYQRLRQSIRNIGPRELTSYTKSVEFTYRGLADLLAEEGRLTEAQQVLDLLKQQEYFGFVRRAPEDLSEAKLAELNALEKEAEQKIRTVAETLLEKSAKADTLQKKPNRTAAEEKELTDLDKEVDAARVAFQQALENLSTLFSKQRVRVAVKQIDLKDTEAFTTTLTTLQQQTNRRPIAIYTLVGENKLRFLVITADGTPVAREYPIMGADLNKKVLAFRQALTNRAVDPRPQAKALYDIVIKPVAADIQGAKADTVMWSLDGTLRYIPLAALSPDGSHYLIESPVRHVIFTPAALSAGTLTRQPATEWKPLALGVTQEKKVGDLTFPALLGVQAELSGLSKALPGGTVLLDDQFTKSTLESLLTTRPGDFRLVHIATHFYFHPTGDEATSFLLLGDGGKLTLADLKTLRSNLFSQVDLLVLSACDTATGTISGGGKTSSGKVADGSEVEGMGVLAQRKGAGAIMASLWPVSDVSTAALMTAFYAERKANPSLGKLEAMRRAQIALLQGTIAVGNTPTDPGRSTPSALPDDPPAPKFTPDPKCPFAHPYYWASFILMGNWE